MPYMQRRRLTIDSDISGSATWRYKLPKVGNFTAFEIRLSANREADRTADTTVFTLATEVDKIELLRGGTRPIISLTALQLDALNYWDLGRTNSRRYRQLADRDNIMTWFLMGGRDLYDREYGYDMSKLGETYLEISHSLTADAADKFDVSTTDLRVYAYQWMGPGAPNFSKYFRTRQLAYWTCSGSGIIKTVEIPVGNPIRRVAFQAATRAYTIGGTVTELELIVNDGEYSPVHIKSPMDWAMAEVAEYDLDNQIGGIDYMYQDSAMDIPYWFSYYQDGWITNHTGSAVLPFMPALVSQPCTLAPTPAQRGEVLFGVKGWGFQKCLRIGFDHERDGFDLLQTTGLGALDLVVTEAGSTRDARVFVQDVISY